MKPLYFADARLTSIKSTLDLYLEDSFKLPILALLFLLFLVAGTFSAYGATFVVTKTADTNDGVCDADCSLREAIGAANTAGTNDIVGFDATVFGNPQNINLTNGELSIVSSGSLVVDGPGATLLRINIPVDTRHFRILGNAVVTINRVTVYGRRETGFGGGIYIFFGTLTLNDSIVTNNYGQHGGGIENRNGQVHISNSTISGNATSAGGGGILNSGELVNITNSTISNNSATDSGGGISNINGGDINLTNVTISNNVTTSGSGIGAGVNNTPGADIVSVGNSIIADNTGPLAPDFSGSLASQGYNLIENTTGTTITGTTTGNILGQDPQLMTLRNNGGPTNTIALQPTSPAIDAGDPNNFLATDQRGVARPQDGDLNGNAMPDIGAYERQVFTSIVTKIADTNDGVCDTDCSLREAILGANTSTNPDNAVVFDATFASPRTIVLTAGELVVSQGGTLLINGGGPNLLTISGNNSSRVFYLGGTTNLTINGATITRGNAVGTSNSGFGGGIYNPGGRLTFLNSVVSENTADYGGGVYSGQNNGSGTLRSIDSIIRNNSAVNEGGGAYVLGDEISFIGSSVVGNSAMTGGGVSSGVRLGLNFGNCDISNNSGGGIRISSRNALISNSRISNNTGYGGIDNAGELVVQGSLISGNTSFLPGGGIFNENGHTLSIINTTVSGNFSDIHGGGIFNANPAFEISVTTVKNSTIVHNSTSGIGGGIFNSLNSIVNVQNTIIANNSAVIQSPDFERVLTSQGYNLLRNTTGTTITGITTGNILGQDPLLDPILKMNGGPTATHALRVGSPAIDKGSATNPTTTTDQRGLLRPYDSPTIPNTPGGNGSDIGAFERQAYDVSGLPIFDFDGDGKTDVGIFRPSVGEWWYQRSSNAQVAALQFGTSTDKIVPGDFTGDGKTDIAFWRPSDGHWFVLRSEDSSYFAFPFGSNGDIPAPADYDGDGRTDPAVFRPSTTTWFISNSGGGGTSILNFGLNGDKPVVADYDGDSKADIAIWRAGPGEWWGVRSTNGSVFAVQFGTTSDRPVQGDYTGDGKADIAFWRPADGNWFIVRSEDSSYFAFPFGSSGDTPVPGDYDGDGKTDSAVFRPASATWFLNRSTAGVAIQQFGLTTDMPIPSAFVP